MSPGLTLHSTTTNRAGDHEVDQRPVKPSPIALRWSLAQRRLHQWFQLGRHPVVGKSFRAPADEFHARLCRDGGGYRSLTNTLLFNYYPAGLPCRCRPRACRGPRPPRLLRDERLGPGGGQLRAAIQDQLQRTQLAHSDAHQCQADQ